MTRLHQLVFLNCDTVVSRRLLECLGLVLVFESLRKWNASVSSRSWRLTFSVLWLNILWASLPCTVLRTSVCEKTTSPIGGQFWVRVRVRLLGSGLGLGLGLVGAACGWVPLAASGVSGHVTYGRWEQQGQCQRNHCQSTSAAKKQSTQCVRCVTVIASLSESGSL